MTKIHVVLPRTRKHSCGSRNCRRHRIIIINVLDRNFRVPHSSKKRKRYGIRSNAQRERIGPSKCKFGHNWMLNVFEWLCDKGNKLEISGQEISNDMNVLKKTRCRIHLHGRRTEYLMRLSLPYLRRRRENEILSQN